MNYSLSFLLLLGFLSSNMNLLTGQNIEFIKDKSSVEFKIKNFGLNVDGRFGDIDIIGNWNSANLSESYFKGSVVTKTVDADIEGRNESLREEEYFHVEKFPKIEIESQSIKESNDSYILFGHLKMKGVSKKIEIPFTVTTMDKELLFTGDFEIDRRNFNVGGNSMVMGDNVKVKLICRFKIKS